MINRNYIGNCIREHRLMIGFTFIFLAVFQFLIIEILITLNFIDIVSGFIKQLPIRIQKFLGEGFLAQFSLKGAMAFGYTHPLVITILSLMAIQIPSKRLSGEIESGAMEFLIALPLRRSGMGLSLIFFSSMALLLVAAGAFSGTIIGMALYPSSRVVPIDKFILTSLNLWVLMMCINSYSMLISSWFNESGRTAMLSAVITLALYFLNYFVQLSDALQFLKPVSLFDYYDPVKTVSGANSVWLNFIILIGLSALFYSAALFKISRRDIPG